jgi:hypothetical protein
MPISSANQEQTHYHAVQFYQDARSLASTVARFLRDGLDAGEPALIVATSSHTAEILAQLDTIGCDTQTLRKSGELQLLDARKMLSGFMVDGAPDSLMFKSSVGDVIDRLCDGKTPCPIRVYGEMVDILWQEGNTTGAIRLEVLWNQLASAYDFSLLCGYAVGNFYKQTNGNCIEDVCHQHSHVVQHPV